MWPNLQETVDLVTFTEEFFKGKPNFLCSVSAASIYLSKYDLLVGT